MKAFFSSFTKATIPSLLLKSFLTAFALSAVFYAPLNPSYYENGTDYAIASVYELLGTYDFKFLLLFAACFFFYKYLSGKAFPKKYASVGLSVFFSFCLLLGQSYYEIGTWHYCFGSGVNFFRFLLSLAGYSFLFHALLSLLYRFFDTRSFTTEQTHFFTRHAFGKAFLILLCAYAPFVLLSYPGNLCWDVIGQIEQVVGGSGYSTHHPLFHTLIVGGFIQAGQALFHSYEIGLFLYTLFQTVLFAAALAATIAVLAKRRAKFSLLLTLLILYCITPVYSNVTSTALKDVPFCAFVIGYVICFALLSETPKLIKNVKFTILFILLQTGVILFRNNGLYVILLGGIGCFLYLFRKLDLKGRILCFFSSFAGSILIGRLILLILVQVCSAAPGSTGEMLSIPFQQTARYLQFYKEEISAEERTAIEAVLGDVNTVAKSYNPNLSDPVKALFDKDASGGELLAYMKAWFEGFLKHPAVYAEGFLVHVYGWFTPSVSNSIRYEAAYDLIERQGLFPYADKLLIFYYRFAGRFTPLGILENVGAAVWALFILTFYQKRRRHSAGICAGLPLWVSLLICMASPCFFNHPRYAFPILFSLPFLYGFTLSHSETEQKG